MKTLSHCPRNLRKRRMVVVRQRGVDFSLTPEIESRLRRAGADSDLLLAIAKISK
jgi:hypothetical protein